MGDLTPRDLAVAKLKESGLSEADLAGLGMAVVDSATELAPSLKDRPALVIRYYDPVTGEPMPSWPGLPEAFYRVRYLGPDTDPAAAAGATKGSRYSQPAHTPPCAYFPKGAFWKDVIKDADTTIIITEGELKAAAACAQGFPTIGLGGVDSWRAVRYGFDFLPSLKMVNWKKRRVIIVYDSDVKGNDQVARALRQFSERLVKEGAYPHTVFLPNLPQCEKTGMDDYLVHRGPDALVELLKRAEPIGLSDVLWGMNEKYTYVRDPGLIYGAKGQRISPGAFKEHLEAATEYLEPVVGNDGEIKRKPVAAGAAWLKWPQRAEADRLTYAPGKPRLTEDRELNTWPGWGCEPKEGDVTPFLRLIDHLFQGAEPGAKEWFLKWCAYPIQNPGVKMYTAAVIWGVGQGTGKSLVGYTLARVYGKNFIEISHRDLEGSFNEWSIGKQFVMGDDITSHDRRRDADHIKKLITQSEVSINSKFVPVYTLPDVINYYITSNHPDAIFIEDDDRRYFVHEVTAPPLPASFYAEYDKWYRSPEGASAIFHYLLNLDLGDWNPRARAPRTGAKERMMLNGMSDIGIWIRQLLESPDAILRVAGVPLEADLYTSAQLLAIYDTDGRGKVSANGIARELSRCGVRQVLDGRPLAMPNGTQGRYFPIRNRDKWRNATSAEIMAHLVEKEKNKQHKF